MSSYREECIKAKMVREGIIEPRPKGHKSSRPKPIVVEAKLLPCPYIKTGGWFRFGNYRTAEVAQTAIDNQVRKHPTLYEFRIKSDG